MAAAVAITGETERSLQAAVYAHCAQQTLEREDGRPHVVEAAMYLAFGDDRQLDGKVGKSGGRHMVNRPKTPWVIPITNHHRSVD